MGIRYNTGKYVRDNYLEGKEEADICYDLIPKKERLPHIKEGILGTAEAILIADHPARIADHLEMLQEYCRVMGYDWEEILRMQENLRNRDGGFEKGILVKSESS